ncbi:hypothetical protein F2P79_023862 [Pimephales promelas]|nr:hypothetical protein F2P79_023862 [Pimephales promelas]
MAGDNPVDGGKFPFKWSKEQTEQFIKLWSENDHLLTVAKNSASVAWRGILEKMGLLGKATPMQAKKMGQPKKNKKTASIQGQERE